MRVRTLAAALVSAAVVCSACGGGGSGSTGVDGDKTIAELSVGELERVCAAMFQSDLGLDEQQLRRWSCYADAIALREEFPLLYGDCEAGAAQCLDDPEWTPFSDDCELDQEDADELPACAADVTVGDIERCLDETADRAAELVDDISCDIDPDAVLELPPACDAIWQVCPEILAT